MLDAVAADKVRRKHARIEQANADLKDSALAHLPSGKFAANSAWLVAAAMAYNLTRAAGVLAEGQCAKARTGTIRRRTSTPRPGSLPAPGVSGCTCPETGHGKVSGRTEPLHRHPQTPQTA